MSEGMMERREVGGRRRERDVTPRIFSWFQAVPLCQPVRPSGTCGDVWGRDAVD